VPGVPGAKVPGVLRVPKVRGVPKVLGVPEAPNVPTILLDAPVRTVLHALLIAALVLAAVRAEAAVTEIRFVTVQPSEALAKITVTCDACAWDVAGREAVVLSVTLDDRYLHHLPVVRTGRADYDVLIGRVDAGRHVLRIEEDAELTAPALRGGSAVVGTVLIDQIRAVAPEYNAISLAPIIYARPDTVGRFTDVPVFMWYEIELTGRGTRYRYSVIFSNEDGGTPADRLMATWGRTTDIEYLYSVEIDRNGAILNEDIQGPEHKILPFDGRREGRHPLLWVSTDNNMVLAEGATRVRYAPAPILFPLLELSREAIMDAHPWLYAVMARELMREGKIIADAPPGQGAIPDPRRFVFVEGCGEVGDTALAFALRVDDAIARGPDGATARGTQSRTEGGTSVPPQRQEMPPWWVTSDRGVAEYRITRNGCFRAGIPLPANAGVKDVRALRVEAFARSGKAADAAARVHAINSVFALDDGFVPGRSILKWEGQAILRPGGPPLEIPIP
jgi:hypothetical protein